MPKGGRFAMDVETPYAAFMQDPIISKYIIFKGWGYQTYLRKVTVKKVSTVGLNVQVNAP